MNNELFNHQPHGIKRLFDSFGVAPSKRWGQNFLIRENVAQKMVESLSLQEGDPVVEIGPGLGAVTRLLLAGRCKVTAFEVDPKLVTFLSTELADSIQTGDLRIVQGDVLKTAPAELPISGLKLIGSLPYAITSPIIHMLIIELGLCWKEASFLIQKEVMVKMTESPPRSNYWYHFIHQVYELDVVERTVAPDSFWPVPGVDSSIIHLQRKQNVQLDMQEWSTFLHKVFNAPRKQIGHAFSKDILQSSSVVHTKRPGELDATDLMALFQQTRQK